jgi:5-methylcytosine-specific restriction endonuclease McrA
MRRIARLPLTPDALRFLKDERTAKVAKKRTLRTKVLRAKELWRQQQNKTFREIRDQLGRMSSGIKRCMYCEDSRGVAIDHFWPLSLYPDKAFEWLNHVYGCTPCNTAKSNDFPLDRRGRPLLIDPTSSDPADDPALHLQLTPLSGKIRALTRRGTESRRVCGLDRPDLTDGRRNAWVVFQELVVGYARLHAAGLIADAQSLGTAIKGASFSAVLIHLLTTAAHPGGGGLRAEVLQALQTHPEIRGWV